MEINGKAGFQWVADALATIDREHLRRRIIDLDVDGVRGRLEGRPVVVFCSNDYLGLSRHPRVVAALRSATSAGSTGARLLSGSRREASALERELAAFVGLESALVFSSGYLAAVGAITALAVGADVILSDERNHACLIDGIRLSKRPAIIYPNGALPNVPQSQRAFIVSETIYGLDGAMALLPTIAQTVKSRGWQLMLDDAHAFGVTGEAGSGLAASHARLTSGIMLGTLSKALGGLGGFIAGPGIVIEYLISRARSFIFDTALPPAIIRAARTALELVPQMESQRRHIRACSRRLRDRLGAFEIRASGDVEAAPHLTSVVYGEASLALAASRMLLERGFFAPALRPPTVPEGTSRIRISLTSAHETEDVDALAHALIEVHETLSAVRH